MSAVIVSAEFATAVAYQESYLSALAKINMLDFGRGGTLGAMKGVLEVLFVGLTPAFAILFLTPLARKIVIGWISLFAWLALWSISEVIIVTLLYLAVGENQKFDFTLADVDRLNLAFNKATQMSSLMSDWIPLITLMLVTGGAIYSMVHFARGMSMELRDQHGAKVMASGNFDAGNVRTMGYAAGTYQVATWGSNTYNSGNVMQDEWRMRTIQSDITSMDVTQKNILNENNTTQNQTRTLPTTNQLAITPHTSLQGGTIEMTNAGARANNSSLIYDGKVAGTVGEGTYDWRSGTWRNARMGITSPEIASKSLAFGRYMGLVTKLTGMRPEGIESLSLSTDAGGNLLRAEVVGADGQKFSVYGGSDGYTVSGEYGNIQYVYSADSQGNIVEGSSNFRVAGLNLTTGQSSERTEESRKGYDKTVSSQEEVDLEKLARLEFSGGRDYGVRVPFNFDRGLFRKGELPKTGVSLMNAPAVGGWKGKISNFLKGLPGRILPMATSFSFSAFPSAWANLSTGRRESEGGAYKTEQEYGTGYRKTDGYTDTTRETSGTRLDKNVLNTAFERLARNISPAEATKTIRELIARGDEGIKMLKELGEAPDHQVDDKIKEIVEARTEGVESITEAGAREARRAGEEAKGVNPRQTYENIDRYALGAVAGWVGLEALNYLWGRGRGGGATGTPTINLPDEKQLPEGRKPAGQLKSPYTEALKEKLGLSEERARRLEELAGRYRQGDAQALDEMKKEMVDHLKELKKADPAKYREVTDALSKVNTQAAQEILEQASKAGWRELIRDAAQGAGRVFSSISRVASPFLTMAPDGVVAIDAFDHVKDREGKEYMYGTLRNYGLTIKDGELWISDDATPEQIQDLKRDFRLSDEDIESWKRGYIPDQKLEEIKNELTNMKLADLYRPTTAMGGTRGAGGNQNRISDVATGVALGVAGLEVMDEVAKKGRIGWIPVPKGSWDEGQKNYYLSSLKDALGISGDQARRFEELADRYSKGDNSALVELRNEVEEHLKNLRETDPQRFAMIMENLGKIDATVAQDVFNRASEEGWEPLARSYAWDAIRGGDRAEEFRDKVLSPFITGLEDIRNRRT